MVHAHGFVHLVSIARPWRLIEEAEIHLRVRCRKPWLTGKMCICPRVATAVRQGILFIYCDPAGVLWCMTEVTPMMYYAFVSQISATSRWYRRTSTTGVVVDLLRIRAWGIMPPGVDVLDNCVVSISDIQGQIIRKDPWNLHSMLSLNAGLCVLWSGGKTWSWTE